MNLKVDKENIQFGTASLSGGKQNDKCSFQGSWWQSQPTSTVYSHITMTTTERLPSSVAKTIEILIKDIHFFFSDHWKKTSTKCYPRNK
jgi:hypothetical protein